MTIVPRRSHSHLSVSHVACLGQLLALSVAQPLSRDANCPGVGLNRLRQKQKLKWSKIPEHCSVEIWADAYLKEKPRSRSAGLPRFHGGNLVTAGGPSRHQ